MTGNNASFFQRKSVASLLAAVGAVSGIAQLIGGFISGKLLIVWSALITLALVLMAVGIDELWKRGHIQRAIARPAVLATAVAALALSVGAVVGFVVAGRSGGLNSLPSSSASMTSANQSAPPTRSTASSTPLHSGALLEEIAGNRLGSPIYGNNMGQPAPDGIPKIPMGSRVMVTCKAENLTGMKSVTYLYKIATSPWEGLYSPSDTFRNGDPPEGGKTAFDPAVPDC
ncbi:hypothetical protein ACN265_25210 [Micromonospora sp. WMMD730]|uniref:hypothetical protein n=1 Tax=Micromonospora sp. WMMD730 TaxID=3404128 RepID=UPI003B93AE54